MAKRAPEPVPDTPPVWNNFIESFMKVFGDEAREALFRGKPVQPKAIAEGAPRRWRGPRKPAAPE